MSTQVTVHREQRFTNCFNVHDAGNGASSIMWNPLMVRVVTGEC